MKYLFISVFCLLALSGSAANILLMNDKPESNPLRYPGNGNFHSDRGTAEFWVKLGERFGIRKQNEHLASLILDENHAIGVYYNFQEKGIVFFIKNVNAPGVNRQSKDYSAFLVMQGLDWKPGENHHIAITYEPEHQLLFIDGKSVRWQEYLGSLAGQWNEKSRIEINRDGGFMIESFRIWDDAFAPRALAAKVSSSQPAFSCNDFPPAATFNGVSMSTGNSRFSWQPGSPLPYSAVSGGRELLPGGARLRFGDRTLEFHGKFSESNGRISGKFISKAVPELQLSLEASILRKDTLRLGLTFSNHGDKPWRDHISLDLGMLIADGMAFTTATGAPFALQTGNPAYAHAVRFTSGTQGGKPNFALPVASVYHLGQDIGMSVAQPMSVQDSISINFGGETGRRYCSVTNADITIPPGGSRTMEYFLQVHSGDFRPALQLMMDISPEAFIPAKINPVRQEKIDAGMIIGGPSDEAFLKQMASLMVGYRQISIGNGKQIVFGEYAPKNPDAESLAYYAGINKQIGNLHQAGILAMIYLQARECKRLDFAKERFSDSLQYDSQGKLIESYSFGAKMLCRKDSAWYRHLIDQLQKSLEKMPGADGVLFDNCWDLEYADIINAFGDYLHGKGLLLATNGISNPCARASDNIMAEGTRKELEWLGYYGLAKPVIYVPIYHYYGFGVAKGRELVAPGLPVNLARDLKSCLVNGGFYAFNYCGVRYFGEESMRIFNSFIPLQQELKGKRWYLAAHAMTLPKGLQGNIYERRNGGLVAFAVSGGMPFTDRIIDEFPVRIRVGEHRVAKVTLRHLEDAKEKPIDFFVVKDGFIEVKVKGHISISMIKVE